MIKKTGGVKIEWDEYENSDSLDSESKLLFSKAKDISRSAYAPYSQFQVGAAVLLENGKIILGTNQENAAYPDGLCAERVAVFAASAKYPDIKIMKIAIAAYNVKKGRFVGGGPCGSCRQAMLEYEIKQQAPVKVIIAIESDRILVFNKVEDLLPIAFSRRELE